MKARRALLTLLFCLLFLPALKADDQIIIDDPGYAGYIQIYCGIVCSGELLNCVNDPGGCQQRYADCMTACRGY